MLTVESTKKRLKSHWLIFLIYLILVFGLEPFYRTPLFNSTITFVEYVQGDHPAAKGFFKLCEFISHLGSTIPFLIIILIVYNFCNIFKTFVLLVTLFVSLMLVGLLKMIYASPRPFFVSEKIIPFGCEGGWGNPSGHSLCSTSFYLTLWHIVFLSKKFRNNSILKKIALTFTSVLILLIMLSRVFVGAHSFNQIFFGMQLGLGVHFAWFHVLRIDVNSSKDFMTIIKIKNLYFGIGNFMIFIFGLLIFIFNKQNQNAIDIYNEVINSKCGVSSPPLHKRFQKEGLIAFAIFLANMGMIFGAKLEFYLSFKENEHLWALFNFSGVTPIGDGESLMSQITIDKDSQWNRTNLFYSLVRLVLIVILSAVLMLPGYFVQWDNYFFVVFVFKILLPGNMVTFGLFYAYKTTFRTLRLVNGHCFHLNEANYQRLTPAHK